MVITDLMAATVFVTQVLKTKAIVNVMSDLIAANPARNTRAENNSNGYYRPYGCHHRVRNTHAETKAMVTSDLIAA